MVKRIIGMGVVVTFIASIIGCATIISGRMQSLPVTSSPDGAIVTMGTLRQQTPCTLELDRRMGVYQIKIEKEGYEPMTVTLKKGVNGWVFGNIIFGGIIGIVIDMVSGSASAFKPSEVEVNLIKQQIGANLKNKDILIVKLKEQINN